MLSSLLQPEDDARAAEVALRAAAEAAAEAERAAAMEEAEVDEALNGVDTSVASAASAIPASKLKQPAGILKNANASGIPKKAKPKPKLTAKEKRERSVSIALFTDTHRLMNILQLFIDKVVSNLPLEYRGQDPVSSETHR